MTLIAYHNDPAIKVAILAQLEAHRAADDIVHGQYWKAGKGCAVGCTIHSGQHAEYEIRFGIPVALAHLEDAIFESLPNESSVEWPIRFMSAIQPGADLTDIPRQFLHWLLTTESVNPGITHPLVRDAVAECAELLASPAVWSAAENAAWSAESAAWHAAYYAAESAQSAAESARSAARSGAWSAAGSVAWSARSAAQSAARSAARSAVESATWSAMADKLISLIEGNRNE